MMAVARASTPSERILQAATALFAELGFNGASTREIARLAAVNDATVYRHFASKRDLFSAVLESELRKLSIRPDLMVRVANAEDVRTALCAIFGSLTEALASQPQLLRLLHFSVLEFGTALQPLYHKYLGDLLDGAAKYLESWRHRDRFFCSDSRAMIAAFAVTVVGLQTLYPLFGSERFSTRPNGNCVTDCADLWLAMLSGPRVAPAGSVDATAECEIR